MAARTTGTVRQLRVGRFVAFRSTEPVGTADE
jgi:hypothetical protein